MYGFIRTGAGMPNVEVANCKYNIERIYEIIKKANEKEIAILTFPELSVTGCTCQDLFHQRVLIHEAEMCVQTLLEKTKEIDMLIALGAPVEYEQKLFNCAVLMHKGKILCIIPKTYIANYGEAYEKRWFSSSNVLREKNEIIYAAQKTIIGKNILLQHITDKNVCIGVEIGEDAFGVISPSTYQTLSGANLILNLASSNDYVGRANNKKSFLANQTKRCKCAYVYAPAGFGESTTDSVYDGYGFIFENGELLEESKRFSIEEQLIFADVDLEALSIERFKDMTFADSSLNEKNQFERIYFNLQREFSKLSRKIEQSPFIAEEKSKIDEACNEMFNIQILGLAKRFKHVHAKSMVVGVSGGLDSTLALLVCAKVCDKLGLDRSVIKAITMPGFGTTDRTYNNSLKMIEKLGADFSEISIKDAVNQHFKDIGHDSSIHDLTYENSQARERTQILMDVAGQNGGFVVGTGDLSELALGWATYNGDHMSMYGVNASIPKTLIKHVVRWAADNQFDDDLKAVLYDVLDTPVSPELLPPDKLGKIAQKTEEIVGPYELHDFFLYYVLKYGYMPSKIYYLALNAFDGIYTKETIYKWLRNFFYRFFSQQFKRSCIPDGPKVGLISISPRGDLKMPSDASNKLWIDDLEKINL